MSDYPVFIFLYFLCGEYKSPTDNSVIWITFFFSWEVDV